MRPLVLVGIVLIAAGGFLFYNGGRFATRKKLVEIGDVKITGREEHTLPRWVAGVAVLAGAGLVVVGARRSGRP